MAVETRCECCDLPVESCGKAAQARLEAAEREWLLRLVNTPPWFPAVYSGLCGECGERFAVGYPIRSSSKRGAYGRAIYIGACCEERA